jgi:hypothetical protein
LVLRTGLVPNAAIVERAAHARQLRKRPAPLRIPKYSVPRDRSKASHSDPGLCPELPRHPSLQMAGQDSRNLRDREPHCGRRRQLHREDQHRVSRRRIVDVILPSHRQSDVFERDRRSSGEAVLCCHGPLPALSCFCRLDLAFQRGADPKRRVFIRKEHRYARLLKSDSPRKSFSMQGLHYHDAKPSLSNCRRVTRGNSGCPGYAGRRCSRQESGSSVLLSANHNAVPSDNCLRHRETRTSVLFECNPEMLN